MAIKSVNFNDVIYNELMKHQVKEYEELGYYHGLSGMINIILANYFNIERPNVNQKKGRPPGMLSSALYETTARHEEVKNMLGLLRMYKQSNEATQKALLEGELGDTIRAMLAVEAGKSNEKGQEDE